MTTPRRRPDLNTPEWRKLRLLVLERDGWQCTYCGVPIEGAQATVDHIIPVAKGGDALPPMHALVAACRSCNSSRQDNLIRRTDWFNRRWLTHV